MTTERINEMLNDFEIFCRVSNDGKAIYNQHKFLCKWALDAYIKSVINLQQYESICGQLASAIKFYLF